MLSCKFSFKAYAKTVREKETKRSLKTAEVLLDTDGYVLTDGHAQTLHVLIFV